MTPEDERQRTYSWADPSVIASHIGRSSGLEMLLALQEGELPRPPIMETLGFSATGATEGAIVVRMTPQEFHYNLLGSVHGGVIATLLDTTTGCAVHSVLAAGSGYTSLDLTTKFLRPVTVDSGELRCEGTVLNRGRTTALAEAKLYDASGKLLAYATSTCVIFDIPPR